MSAKSKYKLALSIQPCDRIAPAGFQDIQIKRCGLDRRLDTHCPEPFHHDPPDSLGMFRVGDQAVMDRHHPDTFQGTLSNRPVDHDLRLSSICPETCERHAGAIVSIQKALSEDAIRTPSKMDSSALPGAQEGGSTLLKWCQGVGCSGDQGPLADDDGPGLGPGIEPRGIGGLTAVVGCATITNDFAWPSEQVDSPYLIILRGSSHLA